MHVLVREVAASLSLPMPAPGELAGWLEGARRLGGAEELLDAIGWLVGRSAAEKERRDAEVALHAERTARGRLARALAGLGVAGEEAMGGPVRAVLTAAASLLGAERSWAVWWVDEPGERSWGVRGVETEPVPPSLHDEALRDLLCVNEVVSVWDGREVDPALRALADGLQSASLLLVQACFDSVCRGFVCFEASGPRPSWENADRDLLGAVARAIFQTLERRRASSRLQVLSLIADNIRDIVFARHSVSGELLYVNQAFERFTGVPAARVRKDAQARLQLLDLEDQVNFPRESATWLAHGGTFRFRMRAADGQMRWMAARAFRVADRDSPLLVGVVEDITDREAHEQLLLSQNSNLEEQVAARTSQLQGANLQLRLAVSGRETALRDLAASESRFRTLVEAIPATVLIVRGADIVYASPTAGQPVERPSEALVGRPLGSVLSGFSVHVDELLRQAREPDRLTPVRQILTLAYDGSRSAILDVSIVRFGEAADLSLLLVGFDVTDRELAAASAREALDRIGGDTREQAMIELSAAFAHELNQPLTALSFFLDAVSAHLNAPQEGVDPQQGLRLALEEALRAGAVVKRLRALFARQVPDRVAAPVGELLEQVCALYRSPAEHAHVHLSAVVEPPDLVIYADTTQIRLALAHLVRNAVRAFQRQHGGQREVEVGARRAGEGVEIWVKDTAPPMDDGVRERVFSSFLGTRAHGVGIGLYLVKRIVEAHGGTFTLAEGTDQKVFRAYYPQVLHDGVDPHH